MNINETKYYRFPNKIIMKKFAFMILIVGLVGVCSGVASGQTLQDGLDAYDKKNYKKALEILKSVRKTRKVVIVDEDYPRCSMATDISALVAEEAFDYLDAPPRLVTPPHTSIPYSEVLENLYIPDKAKVVQAALEVIE